LSGQYSNWVLWCNYQQMAMIASFDFKPQIFSDSCWWCQFYCGLSKQNSSSLFIWRNNHPDHWFIVDFWTNNS
jgi:hypothetical protein